MSKEKCLEILKGQEEFYYNLAASKAIDAINGSTDKERIKNELFCKENLARSEAYKEAYEVVALNI